MAPSRLVRLTESESLKARKEFLRILYDAELNAKTDEDRWVDVSTISCHRPRIICLSLVRLNLIDVNPTVDKFGKKTVYAKINQVGMWAFTNDRFRFRDLKVSFSFPAPIYYRFIEIAKELNIVREDGKPSIIGVLNAVVGREEQFKRWVRAAWAEEFEKEERDAE